MKRSDLCVVLFFYAVCLFFYGMIRDLPEEAQTYPTAILVVLAVLNSCFFVRQFLRREKNGDINDLAEVFSGFQSRQFFGVVLFALFYLLLLPWIGFYVTSLCFLIGTMAFLKVPRLHLAASIVILAGLIYVVFTLFLKVPLPVGRLFL